MQLTKACVGRATSRGPLTTAPAPSLAFSCFLQHAARRWRATKRPGSPRRRSAIEGQSSRRVPLLPRHARMGAPPGDHPAPEIGRRRRCVTLGARRSRGDRHRLTGVEAKEGSGSSASKLASASNGGGVATPAHREGPEGARSRQRRCAPGEVAAEGASRRHLLGAPRGALPRSRLRPRDPRVDRKGLRHLAKPLRAQRSRRRPATLRRARIACARGPGSEWGCYVASWCSSRSGPSTRPMPRRATIRMRVLTRPAPLQSHESSPINAVRAPGCTAPARTTGANSSLRRRDSQRLDQDRGQLDAAWNLNRSGFVSSRFGSRRLGYDEHHLGAACSTCSNACALGSIAAYPSSPCSALACSGAVPSNVSML